MQNGAQDKNERWPPVERYWLRLRRGLKMSKRYYFLAGQGLTEIFLTRSQTVAAFAARPRKIKEERFASLGKV